MLIEFQSFKNSLVVAEKSIEIFLKAQMIVGTIGFFTSIKEAGTQK